MNCFIVILFVILFQFCSIKTNGSYQITLTVLYESQCSTSMKFHRKQLLPTLQELKYLRDNVKVDLVPYGKAEKYYNPQDDLWYFTCQHGHDECRYNMIHACAINILKHKPDQFIPFIGCLMEKRNEDQVMQKCTLKYGIPDSELNKCVYETKWGNQLLSYYGNQTLSYFKYGLDFVPTILVNGKFKKDDQDKALSDLMGLVCRYLRGQVRDPNKICS